MLNFTIILCFCMFSIFCMFCMFLRLSQRSSFFFCVFRTWAYFASFLEHLVVPFRDGGLIPLPNRLETRKLEWQSHAMVNLRSLVNAKRILVKQR